MLQHLGTARASQKRTTPVESILAWLSLRTFAVGEVEDDVEGEKDGGDKPIGNFQAVPSPLHFCPNAPVPGGIAPVKIVGRVPLDRNRMLSVSECAGFRTNYKACRSRGHRTQSRKPFNSVSHNPHRHGKEQSEPGDSKQQWADEWCHVALSITSSRDVTASSAFCSLFHDLLCGFLSRKCDGDHGQTM